MKAQPISEKLTLVLLCGLAYFLLDAPFQMTGLFFGIYGILGCVVSSLLLHLRFAVLCSVRRLLAHEGTTH